MDLADPRDALNDLQTAIAAVLLPASFDPATPAAFDKVAVFDLQNLAVAMEELFAYSNRIALIALDAVDHNSSVLGRTLRVAQSLSITILFSDRRYSDRQKALMGDSTTPGALFLQTLLVNAVTGELPNGGVVQPRAGRLVALENADRTNETGRIVFAQDFDVATSWDAISSSRNARLAAAA